LPTDQKTFFAAGLFHEEKILITLNIVWTAKIVVKQRINKFLKYQVRNLRLHKRTNKYTVFSYVYSPQHEALWKCECSKKYITSWNKLLETLRVAKFVKAFLIFCGIRVCINQGPLVFYVTALVK
jgi:hypothetical protein